jgi:replicative DNA helicase
MREVNYRMYRTTIGQGTLASTNQLLLRVFSCEFFGLHNQTVIYVSTNIHSHLKSESKQYTIQRDGSNNHTPDNMASAYDRMSSKNNITIIMIDNSLYSC